MVNDGEVLVYERGICQNLHFDHRWYIFPSLINGVAWTYSVIIGQEKVAPAAANDGEVRVHERGFYQNLHFDHRWCYFFLSKTGKKVITKTIALIK